MVGTSSVGYVDLLNQDKEFKLRKLKRRFDPAERVLHVHYTPQDRTLRLSLSGEDYARLQDQFHIARGRIRPERYAETEGPMIFFNYRQENNDLEYALEGVQKIERIPQTEGETPSLILGKKISAGKGLLEFTIAHEFWERRRQSQ